ncbi:MAG: PKD domain-containing protein [Flavobacteriales bacterium]|nr:PKD domain-containing protein [Flavobacteriales bacterium]
MLFAPASEAAPIKGLPEDVIAGQGAFLENRGQWDDPSLFRAAHGDLHVFMERDAITLSWVSAGGPDGHAGCPKQGAIPSPSHVKGHAWRMRFQGASPDVLVAGERPGQARYHFIKGQDPQRWASHVRSYEAVRYQGLWDGVDMLFHQNGTGFKYDVLLARADQVGVVGFLYEGHDGIFLDAEGRLTIVTSMGELMEMAPVAWYADGRREAVPCRFTLVGDQVGFAFAPGVDPARPVVIDPQLLACTLSGMTQFWTGTVRAVSATHDAMGNPIMCGYTASLFFPVTLGAFGQTSNNVIGDPEWAYDIVIGKYSADGTQLLFGTYLGGTGTDLPIAMRVAPDGELILYANTASHDYPVTPNAFDPSFNGVGDMAITRFTQDGSGLVGSTYVGSGNVNGYNSLVFEYQDNHQGDLKLDAQGRIWVVGATLGASFPTTPGAYQPPFMNFQNGVIFCMSPDLSTMVHGAYLGTLSADMIHDIAFNAAGEPYVCGATMGALPTTPGAYQPVNQGGVDGFVVHFSADLSTILHATYVGTPAWDEANFIVIDNAGDVYLHGMSSGVQMELHPADIHHHADGTNFFMKLDASLSTRIFSSRVHPPLSDGNGNIFPPIPVAFDVDLCGRLMSTIIFARPDLEVTPDALWSTGGLYVSVYAPNMAGLAQATYLQGSNHAYGGRARYDEDGVLYLAACNDVIPFGVFPTTPGAFGPALLTVYGEGGIYKLRMDEVTIPPQPYASPTVVCVNDTVQFGQLGVGVMAVWDFGDGSPTQTSVGTWHVYDAPGAYQIAFITMGDGICDHGDTIFLAVQVHAPVALSAAFDLATDFCAGLQVDAVADDVPDVLHAWSTGDGAEYEGPVLSHVYQAAGGYWITHVVISTGVCASSDTAQQWVTVEPGVLVAAAFDVELTTDCSGVLFVATDASTGMAPVHSWDMGDGTLLQTASVEHLFAVPGSFTITLFVTDSLSCNLADTAQYVLAVPDVTVLEAGFTWELVPGCGQVTVIASDSSIGVAPVILWTTSDGASYTTTDITHVFTEAGAHTLTLTVSDPLGCAPPSSLELPVLVEPEAVPQAAFAAQQVGNCAMLTVGIVDMSTAASWAIATWHMGDGTTYEQAPELHTYANAGSYVITLSLVDPLCGTSAQTQTTVIMEGAIHVVIEGDPVLCPGATNEMMAVAEEGAFTWSGGQSGPSIWVDSPGTYTVTVVTPLCQGNASLTVTEPPRLALGDTLDACPGRAVHMASNIAGQEALWSNGATGLSTHILTPGDHWLTLVDAWGCLQSDTIHLRVIEDDGAVYVPNAFTPDGDGLNDHFAVFGATGLLREIEVFDRWGHPLWHARGEGHQWDGTTRSVALPAGVYVYRIRYDHPCEAGGRERYGHVTLVR